MASPVVRFEVLFRWRNHKGEKQKSSIVVENAKDDTISSFLGRVRDQAGAFCEREGGEFLEIINFKPL